MKLHDLRRRSQKRLKTFNRRRGGNVLFTHYIVNIIYIYTLYV